MLSTSLVYAAGDRKHRPASHPVLMGKPLLDEGAYYAHIAARIRLLRAGLGMTQREFGARVGVSGVTVHHWEHANQRPTAWSIDRIERLFGQVRP